MGKRRFGFYVLLGGIILWGDQGAFCLHNLLLDGQKVDTVSVGQPFLLSLDLERMGGQAGAEIWMDLDGDRRIEPERDFLVTSGEGMFKDGGPDDQDSLQDGSFRLMIRGNWPLPGGFILRVWDDGVSDSAYLLQIPVSSGYSISGMVVNPMEKEKLVVYASLGMGRPPAEEVAYAAFTDQNGDYRIWVPESLGVQNWLVGSLDIIGVAPGYISPVPLSVLVDGEITGVNLAYQEATAWVQGRVMAQDGEGISGVRVDAEEEDGGLNPSVISDSLGDYLLGIKDGRWTIGLDADDLIPDYLVSESRKIRVDQGDTILLDIVCFKANGAISGTVYTNQVKPSGMEIEGWCDFGWTTTRTDTVGAYALQVADSVGDFSLRVKSPEGFYVEEGQMDGVLAGEERANFHILRAGAFLQGSVYGQKGKGIPRARVSTWGKNGSFSTQTDHRGYYRIYAPSGTYTLQVQKDGYHTGIRQDVVMERSVLTNDFLLNRLPGMISGHIYGSDGSPLRSAWITAVDSLSEDNFSVSTDWSGFYRLSTPYATLSLTAIASGYEEQREVGITLNPSHPDREVNFYLLASGETKRAGKLLPLLLFPNPFSQETLIRFFLKGRGEREVRVGIYNPGGERVKLLFNDKLPAGPYQFAWRGRDEEREKAKSGLYFLRLDVGGERSVKKMFLIR